LPTKLQPSRIENDGRLPEVVETLTEAKLLELAQRGDLPSRSRITLSSRQLRPTFSTGAVLELARRSAAAGDIVCAVFAGRLVWRRVIAVRGDELLLRREIAPFPDGWFTAMVVGCVDNGPLLHRFASRFPVAWTLSAWWSAWALTGGLNLARSVRVKLRPRLAFTTRVLGSEDEMAFRQLYDGSAPSSHSLPKPDTAIAIGLFYRSELVGSMFVNPSGRSAICLSLYVAPALRGHGGGFVLVRAAVEEARKRNIKTLTCQVAFRNFASMGAFRRVGFIPTGRWCGAAQDPFAASENQLLELMWIAEDY